METNRISDESQRKTILLNSCGITTYKLFKGLKVPAISQNAVIQSGFLNNKSERQILKDSDKEVKKCCRCDGNHAAKSCPFIDKEDCFYCHNKDYTSKACRKKAKPNKVKVNNVVQTKENSTEVDNDEF